MVLVKLNLKNSRIVCFQFSPPIELSHSTLTTNLVLVALKSSFLGESPHSVVASCSLPFCVRVLEGGHGFPRLILYTSFSSREKPEIVEKVPLSCSVRNTSQNKRTGEQLRTGSVSERAGKMAQGEGAFRCPETESRPWGRRNVRNQCAHSDSWLWWQQGQTQVCGARSLYNLGSHYKNKYKASNLKVLPEKIPRAWAHFTARWTDLRE